MSHFSFSYQVKRETDLGSFWWHSYEALLLRKELENDERFVWCKNPQCKSGQVHKGGSTYPFMLPSFPCLLLIPTQESRPVVICTTCHARSCFKHDRPWHDGMTCDEFDKKLKQEEEEAERKATDKYLATHTKMCPNEKCGKKVGGTAFLFLWSLYADQWYLIGWLI